MVEFRHVKAAFKEVWPSIKVGTLIAIVYVTILWLSHGGQS